MKKNILNEELMLEINKSLDQAINILLEMEQVSDRTYVWDLAKEKIDKSTNKVNSAKQAEQYLINFLEKIKRLPKGLKIKLSKYVLASLIGISSLTNLSSIIKNEAPELGKHINFASFEEDDEDDDNDDEEKVKKKKKEKVEIPTEASDSLVNFLKYEEGSLTNKGEPVLKAYNIGDGAVTVGWGHATKTKDSKIKVGDYISKEQAEKFLKSDIKWAEDRLNAIIDNWKEKGLNPKINQNMYDAMVSLIFNMGIGNFRGKIGKEFLKHVKKGNIEDAKKEILKMSSNLYKKYPGIKHRRQKESELFNPSKEDAHSPETLSESYKSRLQKLAGII